MDLLHVILASRAVFLKRRIKINEIALVLFGKPKWEFTNRLVTSVRGLFKFIISQKKFSKMGLADRSIEDAFKLVVTNQIASGYGEIVIKQEVDQDTFWRLFANADSYTALMQGYIALYLPQEYHDEAFERLKQRRQYLFPGSSNR